MPERCSYRQTTGDDPRFCPACDVPCDAIERGLAAMAKAMKREFGLNYAPVDADRRIMREVLEAAMGPPNDPSG